MRDRPAFDLFLISWLVLFLELACIRWFPSHVLFLTFFVNLVLLACFVGMSVGCLVARRPDEPHPVHALLARRRHRRRTAHRPLLRARSRPCSRSATRPSPDVVYFGTETSVTLKSPLPFAVPMELVGGAVLRHHRRHHGRSRAGDGPGVQPRPEPHHRLLRQPARQPRRHRHVRRAARTSGSRRSSGSGSAGSSSRTCSFAKTPTPPGSPRRAAAVGHRGDHRGRTAPAPVPSRHVAAPAARVLARRGRADLVTSGSSGQGRDDHLVAVLPHRLRPPTDPVHPYTNLISQQMMEPWTTRRSRRPVRAAVPVPARPEEARRHAGVAAVQAGAHHRRRQRQRRRPRAPVRCRTDAAIDRRGRDRPGHPEARRAAPPGQAVPGPAREGHHQRRPQLPPRGQAGHLRPRRLRAHRLAGAPVRATRTCGWRATCSRWNRSRT